MTVCFDGLRRNATNSMSELHYAIQEMFDNDRYNDISEDMKENVKEKFNHAGRMVTSFNCLYDDNIKDDMTNMSDLDCKYFKEKE